MTDLEFDAARDELVVGDDIYDPHWVAPIIRHPSRALLSKLTVATYPATVTGTPCPDIHGVPAPEREPSSGAQGPSSSRNEPQPERGTARAA